MALQDFEREEFQAPMAEINTTPLVDVMLVLMVIFLVTAPLLTHTIQLDLPKEVAQASKDQSSIKLSISRDGRYYWNAVAISDAELAKRLQTVSKADKSRPIHIHADAEVAYRRVSKALALAQRYSLRNIGFATDPTNPER